MHDARRRIDMGDEVKKQEKRRETKHTLKTVVISVICTLLFVIILLFVVILCLRGGCNKNKSNSNSNSSSSQKYNYDNTKLDAIFKKLVFNQVFVDMGSEDPIDDIYAVSYSDSGSSFSLNIDAKIGDNIYYYSASNVTYSGYTNLLTIY